jgi:serine/threonine protein kinase
MTEPRLADDIDETSDHAADDDSDVVDQVAEEFADRCRRGEAPSIDEYVRRYPEHSGRIRELLPSVAMMERLKRQVRASAEGAAEPAEPVPERLGEYQIVRELGRGGMGIVYEAFQESLGRHVALKVIPRHGLLEGKRRRRFQREAIAVAQLHHTNIVPIFAAGEHDGLPFYAMQYIRGSGLDRLLESWRRDGLVPGPDHWRFVARVGVQAAEALEYAHGQGIMHRDIKPANVLIDEHQVAWITDFGLAKLAGRDDLTNSGDVVGTLRYLAPEALSGQNDGRGDVYSLGLTLYELLTLRLPFGELSPSELLRCVTEEQPTRPRKLDRTIPLDLETIVLKATAREPGHRYATAGELADDLRAFLDDRPIRARRASPPERLARWCRRNRLLAGVSAFAVASFLAALVFATVGYVTTHRALQKSDANVKIALDAFERLFNEFTDPMDGGPFAEGEPKNGGMFGPRHDDARVPRGIPPEINPPGRPGPPPPGHGPGPGPHRRGDENRPGGGPMMAERMELSGRELGLLTIVLDFYDGFAEGNETNSQLQGEAARAYRKVAALYRVLGRQPEAEAAQARALERFQSLVRRNGEDSEYSYELARTLALDGPGALEVPSDRAEPDLRRAIAMVEGLFDRAPERKQITYAAALARWKGRLAERLDSLGRTEEAAAAYAASIAHDEWLSGHLNDPWMVRDVLATRRASLAEVLIRLGRKDEARGLVDRVAADVVRNVGEGDQHRSAGFVVSEPRRRSTGGGTRRDGASDPRGRPRGSARAPRRRRRIRSESHRWSRKRPRTDLLLRAGRGSAGTVNARAGAASRR